MARRGGRQKEGKLKDVELLVWRALGFLPGWESCAGTYDPMSIEVPPFVVPHISEWTTSSMWGKISDVKFNNSQPTLWCSGSSAHPQCYHCLPAHSQKDCCKGLVSRSLHIIGGLGGPSGPVEDSRSGRCERQIDASGSNPVKAINVVTFFCPQVTSSNLELARLFFAPRHSPLNTWHCRCFYLKHAGCQFKTGRGHFFSSFFRWLVTPPTEEAGI